MIKRLSLLLAGLLWVALAALSLAADNPAAQDQNPNVAADTAPGQDDQQDQTAGETEAGTEEEETEARFIPTEEISQDLGVSFPVDI